MSTDKTDSTLDYDAAHKHCIRHQEEVEQSTMCGCFYCLEIFPKEDIVWGRYEETTGSCPHCGIDSVIPDAAGYPITKSFLAGMNQRWFCQTRRMILEK